MKALAFLLAALATAAEKPAQTSAAPDSTGKWSIQFHFDKDQEEFEISDIAAPGPGRAIAVGTLSRDKGRKAEGLAVLTRDGGKTWTEVPIKEPARSVYFLDESQGWVVTDGGIWHTDESGLSWRKIKGMRGVLRVWFTTPERGWAVGAPKLMMETADGGKTWSDVEAAKDVKANPDYTSYNWIQFVTPKNGLVNGTSIPPRRDSEREPAWADPEAAAKRRQWPNLSIGLDTRDGGKTWTSETAPIFGRPARFRFNPGHRALALVRFDAAFEYPSEVYSVDPKTGKSTRAFREKNRMVTDVGWLPDSRGALIAVEPAGMFLLPVPRRLHVLTSADLEHWQEMPVDWKAYAGNAVLATSNESAWIGTDTGMILKLVTP